MSQDTAPFTFTCGCEASAVGQAFKNSILVCPIHEDPMGAYDHPAGKWQGRLGLEVTLATNDRAHAQRYMQALEATLLADDAVTGITTVLEGPE